MQSGCLFESKRNQDKRKAIWYKPSRSFASCMRNIYLDIHTNILLLHIWWNYIIRFRQNMTTGPDFFPSPTRWDERKTPGANPWKVCPPPAPTGGNNIPITGGYLRWLLSWPHSSYLGIFYWWGKWGGIEHWRSKDKRLQCDTASPAESRIVG